MHTCMHSICASMTQRSTEVSNRIGLGVIKYAKYETCIYSLLEQNLVFLWFEIVIAGRLRKIEFLWLEWVGWCCLFDAFLKFLLSNSPLDSRLKSNMFSLERLGYSFLCYIYCGSTATLFNKVYCHSSWKFLSCGVSAVVVVYLYLSYSNLQMWCC